MENRQLHQGDSRGVHNDEQGPAARLVERLISGHVAAPGELGTMVPTAMNPRPLKLGPMEAHGEVGLDLYWIPLGAGAHVVRSSGEAYEALAALAHHRSRRDLYHSALVAGTGVAQFTIEMTPIPDARGWDERGVVAEGPVGSIVAGRLRLFRYEIRRWRNGVIPDIASAVDSPVRLTGDARLVQEALDAVPFVPTPVWGRDELRAGEMWNSNSVVAWILTRIGLERTAGHPPGRGRAPGWDAGVTMAERQMSPPQIRCL